MGFFRIKIDRLPAAKTPYKRQPAFDFVAIDDQIAAARGAGGGVALWAPSLVRKLHGEFHCWMSLILVISKFGRPKTIPEFWGPFFCCFGGMVV